MTITKIDFDPDKKSIKDIFEGSIRMIIPKYQRTYSWTKEKVEEFYDDFVIDSEKPEDNLAYLGTILFSKDKDGNLEVIDGQQRLVTITIFFAAMRDLSRDFLDTDKAKDFASGLQKLICNESVFGSSFLDDQHTEDVKLKVGTDIEKIFNELIYNKMPDLDTIIAKKPAEKNVLNSYNLFYNKVKSSIDHPKTNTETRLRSLVRLVQKILSIEYIDIRVINDEVAYNLFESHNAKGVALAKTDLIKNYYFGRLKGNDSEKNSKINEWDNLLDLLENKTSNMLPDRFFNYMIQSYDGHFSSSVLYRRIKPHIQNPSKFQKMLKDNINFIVDLKTADTEDKHVNISLRGIEKMKVNQCFIFLLCLYRNKSYMNPKSYQTLVEIIEKFTYIYSTISKQPTNALEKIYSKHAKKLQDEVNNLGKSDKLSGVDKERIGGKLISALRADLLELLPTLTVFSDGLSNLSYDKPIQKTIIRYTFEKIEYYNSKGMVNLGDLFTLDHIIPRSKFKNNGLYDTIGNLVPLSSKDNSTLGNKDPHQKINVYKENSNFYLISGLINKLESRDVFDKDDIMERNMQIAKFIYENVFSIKN